MSVLFILGAYSTIAGVLKDRKVLSISVTWPLEPIRELRSQQQPLRITSARKKSSDLLQIRTPFKKSWLRP